MIRVCVWCAGEFAGFGKVFFHASRSGSRCMLTTPKRCFRVRGTHDLETRQHCLSAPGSSRRESTMESWISGGRYEPVDIEVLVKEMQGIRFRFASFRALKRQSIARLFNHDHTQSTGLPRHSEPPCIAPEHPDLRHIPVYFNTTLGHKIGQTSQRKFLDSD